MAQSDAGLKTGNLALIRFFFCAQYRAESTMVLRNRGLFAVDKTPLLYLARPHKRLSTTSTGNALNSSFPEASSSDPIPR